MGEKTRDLSLLVTGGQGFLGGALVRALVSLGFTKVAATARRAAPELEEMGVELVKADLTDREQARQATEGRDVILHTAAKAGVWGSYQSYYGINVEATEFLLQGAQQNGVRYFIHTSSPSVTFQGESSSLETEEADYGYQPLNSYCATKIASEKSVLQAEHSFKTLALRPHLIYGPGDPHLLPRVYEAAKAGRLARVGDGLNYVDVTHIDDAVAAQLCCLFRREDPEIWGEAYFVTSGVPIRLWSWLSHLLHWKGLPRVARSLGLNRAVKLGGFLESVYRRLEKTEEPPLTKFSALQLGCTHTYSIEKARQKLGYSPTVHPYAPFEDQFKEKQDAWACFRSLP